MASAIAEEEEVKTEVEESASEVVAESTPVVPPEPPADCPAHVRAHYDAIREKEREVRVLEGEYFSAKEEAAEAKKGFEAADKALRNLISRGADPQLSLPLTDAAPVAPEAWRAAPFAELGLTDKQNELFESASVTTIGGLEDLRAKIAEGKAEWPKGVGPAKVTDIENRVIDWLDKNRDKFGESVQAAEATTDEAADNEALAADCEKLFEAAGIADKVHRNVTIGGKAKSNGKAKHKANGKAKAKKKAKR